MNIRTATMEDLDIIADAENRCFPAGEAAGRHEFEERLRVYAEHFWLLFDDGKLVSFIDGLVTDEADLTDVMYEDASMHNENGAWQMIFGVITVPEARKKGNASYLLQHVINEAEKQGRKGLVLTCKDSLIHFYERHGFVNEGVSDNSFHGGVSWYQMRLSF